MSRKPITTINELYAMVDGTSGVPVDRCAVAMEAEPHQAAPLVMVLPAPRNGMYYEQVELASVLGRKWSALHSWISRGVLVNGKRVKMGTLRVPKGGVAAENVAQFFRRVNGVEVVIAA